MTITALPVVKNGCLMIRGKIVLTHVPSNLVLTPCTSGSAFLGARSDTPGSRHVFDLGTLVDRRFVCLFIPKIWWMIPRVGKSAREIPIETQMLLLEAEQDSVVDLHVQENEEPLGENKLYILILPLLDEPFRASLQGTPSDKLQFCYESGDPQVETCQASKSIFVNSGENPFELIKESIQILSKHKGTFNHLENKKIPAHLDWFGWCTWDAFYTDVSPDGIKQGLQSFKDGGISPKFLIIDDGWQETKNEFTEAGKPFVEGMQFATRLSNITENGKFRNSNTNLKELIQDIKENYGLEYVYMWHALAGYWGGVLDSSEALKKYNPKLHYPIQSSGNLGNIRDIAMDSLEKYGVGVIDPEKIYDFYNDMHSYLADCGADGVKVDVQNALETLGAGYGGRITITRKYQHALDESIQRNFKGNNLICCMCHNSDSIFSSTRSATARASEDFMPNEPTYQTLHIASVSFNSLFLGEVFVPDWDMFHSDHVTAEFHGAARAVGGCPVYVSDKPGKHDFKILRKLVLPDGSILRAKHAGRPTRDCLFVDPVMDGKSLLKIWNLNKLTGVIGVFNCQGAGSWPMKQAPTSSQDSSPVLISGHVNPFDVEFLDEISGENWSGNSVLYAFMSATLHKVAKNSVTAVEVSLGVLECEVFTVSPIKVLNKNVEFAPIGLINMYNSGGAIEECHILRDSVTIKARGPGIFGVYSSVRPTHCKVDNMEEAFIYVPESGLLTLDLQSSSSSFKEIEIVY